MRTTPFLLLSFLLPSFLLPALAAQDPAATAAAPTARARLTFADTAPGRVSFVGRVPMVRWVDGGAFVEILAGKAVQQIDPATGESRRAAAADAAGAAGAASKRKVVRIHDGDLWLDEDAGGPTPRRRRGPGSRRPSEKAVRLTTDGSANGRKAEAHLSPDQSHVAFTRGNDLVVLDVPDLSGVEALTRQDWVVTSDGSDELFHGVLDWVYQEELYGRGDFQAHWWSPNSDRLAFLSLDESKVREFTVIDHVPSGFLDEERTVVAEVSNYPKAGDPNPTARVSIAAVADRKVTAVDLSKYPADVLVVRVGWTPDGATLLLCLQDRIQTWAELAACDPATGAVTTWIREQSPTWVNRPEPPRWLDDGSFLWLSERTGYQHVYHYRPGGAVNRERCELVAAVTAGDWQVRSVAKVDEKNGVLWFEGSMDGAIGRHYYRVGLDGRGLACVTPGVGTHAADINDAGTFLIDRWSAMDQPTVVVLRDAATGAVVKELAKADRGDGETKYAMSERQRLTIPARDGYELDACLMLPLGWQPGQRYPIYLPTYSGPDAPTVRDSWSHSTYNQFLAQEGFVVLQVNVRSASGRGQQHTGTAYQQLGIQELSDLEDAVAFVCSNHGGDPARVAISGWSYGGFMTAFALTHSDKFALGLAGAGVYDWRLYDTIYTERYMRTPQENQKGYDATSVIKAAKNLHGHLVLLHGSMDDNVHMQNTMQLLWALQSAGVQDFELMIYPRSRHGLDPRVREHSNEFQWLRLRKLLDTKAGD